MNLGRRPENSCHYNEGRRRVTRMTGTVVSSPVPLVHQYVVCPDVGGGGTPRRGVALLLFDPGRPTLTLERTPRLHLSFFWSNFPKLFLKINLLQKNLSRSRTCEHLTVSDDRNVPKQGIGGGWERSSLSTSKRDRASVLHVLRPRSSEQRLSTP